jgi:hypothetical protein
LFQNKRKVSRSFPRQFNAPFDILPPQPNPALIQIPQPSLLIHHHRHPRRRQLLLILIWIEEDVLALVNADERTRENILAFKGEFSGDAIYDDAAV